MTPPRPRPQTSSGPAYSRKGGDCLSAPRLLRGPHLPDESYHEDEETCASNHDRGDSDARADGREDRAEREQCAAELLAERPPSTVRHLPSL